MFEMLQPASWSQQDYAWLRTAMCKFVLAACDQSRDFPGYVNEERIASRLCAPWKKAGLAEQARQLAAIACAPRPFRAPTVDSVRRMLDMFGPQGSVEHVDVQVKYCSLRRQLYARRTSFSCLYANLTTHSYPNCPPGFLAAQCGTFAETV